MEEDYVELNSSAYTDDYYTLESLAEERIVQWTGNTVAAIYLLTLIIGIPANIYVLIRMKRLACSDLERYRNGTGIALCSMAAADLCSLLLICAQNLHQAFTSPDPEVAEATLMQITCKLMLFLTHTVTGISIWSWLLLSSLRYLAICHPLYHLRLWQMPYRALAFIVSMSIFLNAWLLVAVESNPHGCTQVPLIRDSLLANRLFHLIESIWSFCIPLAVIVIMDASVVIKSTVFPHWKGWTGNKKERRKSALEEIIKLTRSKTLRIKARHQHALWKWLVIALVCILLNAPENIYRLVMLFSLNNFTEDATLYATRMMAQALYFSQFAFNAIYLAVFVYDKSTRCKSDSSAQNNNTVPLIIRSRLHSSCEVPESPPPKESQIRLVHDTLRTVVQM